MAKRKAPRERAQEWDRRQPAPRGGRGFQLPAGAHPQNTGGKKGRSGRKPDAWKDICEGLATSDEVLRAAKAVLKNAKHPAWFGAWKFVGEQRFGRAKQSVEHSGTVTHELAERLERAQQRLRERRQ